MKLRPACSEERSCLLHSAQTAHVKNGRQVVPHFTSLVHWLLWILIVRMRLHITCEAVPQRNRQSFGPVNFARTTTSMKPSCSYASASVDVWGFHDGLL